MSTCDRKIAKDECETDQRSRIKFMCIVVLSSFVCLLMCCYAVARYGSELRAALNSFVYNCLLQKLFRFGNAGRWKLIINYTSI